MEQLFSTNTFSPKKICPNDISLISLKSNYLSDIINSNAIFESRARHVFSGKGLYKTFF